MSTPSPVWWVLAALVAASAPKAGHAVTVGAAPTEPGPTANATAPRQLHFEPSADQPAGAQRCSSGQPGRFLARGHGYQVVVGATGAELAFEGSKAGSTSVGWELLGAGAAQLRAEQPLAARSHYLIGSDQACWRQFVPHFAKLRAGEVYRGVDLVWHGVEGALTFDFELAPGAALEPVRLRWRGHQSLAVLADGSIEVAVDGGSTLRLSAPVVYQVAARAERGGELEAPRQRLAARFVTVDADTLAFAVEGRDPAARLVIDPTLSWATYLGGTGEESATGVAVAPDGGIVVVGRTTSTAFPTASPRDPSLGGASDAFVSKLAADGRTLIWSTYLGGSTADQAYAVAVDAAGNVVVAGDTDSADFPVQTAFQATKPSGATAAFVSKLSPHGSSLVFSTYFASQNCGVCPSFNSARALALDGAGNVYFAGRTFGGSFPSTPGVLRTAFARSCNIASPDQCSVGGSTFDIDAFVAKLSPSGARTWATLHGGLNYSDIASALAVDGSQNVYVAGSTGAGDFPTTPGAFIATHNSFGAPFVSKLNASATALVYSTLLDDGRQPALASSSIHDLALAAGGEVTAVGFTNSVDFPTTPGAFQAPASPPPASIASTPFVTRVAANGGSLAASTLLGGGAFENAALTVAVRPNGATVVGGVDSTTVLPSVGYPAATSPAFVVELNPAFSTLLAAGKLARAREVRALALAGDDLIIAGRSTQTGLATGGAFQTTLSGPSDVFVARITPGPPPSCVADTNHLCLQGGRFRVSVTWQVASAGSSGDGRAVALTADTGYFWFFNSANVELVLKVLDGRALSGAWWVFYGALSDVSYVITVEDTDTGQVATYSNPQGSLASVADTEALPDDSARQWNAFALDDGRSASAGELAELVDEAKRTAATSTTGSGSPTGSTYDVETLLSQDTNGDGVVELFGICPGSGDSTVTFNGVSENLRAYTCASQRVPRVTESFTDHPDGTATVEIRVTSSDSGDLFPSGLVSGSTPVTGAGFRLGHFTGSNPLDWTPPHRVLAATIDLRANGASVFTGGAAPLSTTAFFDGPNPWDGHLGVHFPNGAGNNIDEVVLRLTVEHPEAVAACVANDTQLCLNGDRFRVAVSWRTANGVTGVGHGVEITSDTGYFWFFNAANVELVVKILDGRGLNDHWWVFYGALSDVAYTITITDTETGATKTYTNQQGNLASVADTRALE